MITMRRAGVLCALVLSALLAGCGTKPQLPVELAPGTFAAAKAKGAKIGVVMAELPKPDTQFPGANCLLCIGVANAAHSAMNKEVQSFSTAELLPLPADIVALLRKQGLDAVLIQEPLKLADLPDLGASDPTNKARKNYGSLKDKHKIDKLLVVQVTTLGVWRSYALYVPTDPPRAVLYGDVQLIDLGTHALDWYLPLSLSRAAEGAWDEPPKFPGLANAYFQVLETGMDMIKKPLTPK
jgi:hypothetical protein